MLIFLTARAEITNQPKSKQITFNRGDLMYHSSLSTTSLAPKDSNINECLTSGQYLPELVARMWGLVEHSFADNLKCQSVAYCCCCLPPRCCIVRDRREGIQTESKKIENMSNEIFVPCSLVCFFTQFRPDMHNIRSADQIWPVKAFNLAAKPKILCSLSLFLSQNIIFDPQKELSCAPMV